LQKIKAEKATHYVLGLTRNLGNETACRIELYHKDIDFYLLPKDEVYFAPGNDGVGYAKGVEILIEKKEWARAGWMPC